LKGEMAMKEEKQPPKLHPEDAFWQFFATYGAIGKEAVTKGENSHMEKSQSPKPYPEDIQWHFCVFYDTSDEEAIAKREELDG
jgi:hypothetical protein